MEEKIEKATQIPHKIKQKFNRFLRILGPGLITGAADDDPSGIATYSQTGAQFGYGQLWTALYMLPFMTAVQEACARIGTVTGKGIAAVVREHYSKKVLYIVTFLIVGANTINIGADIGAMAAAARLLIPLNFIILTVIFTAIILVLEIFTPYKVYARILKLLAFTLLAYPITVILVSQPWEELLLKTLVPHIEFNFSFLFIITGVIGTTISPYMFFWQASEEVEEEISEHRVNQSGGIPRISWNFIKNMRIDNFIGMFASEIAMWSIIVATATILHNNGVTNINSAADAARALEPLVHSFPNAGIIAKAIFATGVIGLGFLAIPILAGSASYALSETLNWREGLFWKFKQAHGFYGIIIAATLIGLLINFIGIDPIKALIYAAVINGIVSVPLIFLIARIAQNKKIMGDYKSGWISKTLVWSTFVGMGLAAIAMFATFIH
ncbi:MAG: iron transporter [Candidatus Levybacteria bacterium CG_4_10_14_0_2_um_filter_36_16]|nr:MAG: iron transporter [Candidatus Levybacteria bacterium CG2_30_37_29]PIR78872.1 MAG: iron transporter [Candidatus Levybacteria bacterium CG10_big_fil_rev_8_21_14_0_10_36_30]PIZ96536.1 MAG: iron transporter [Candidatus Levybacteria bacterium CG_4_10_14_0_2_um_filter_36_16]PJA90580.1 MAG: iron transporter [Candidatus Levybacteria bacterium CG_4_9_14_3_um_filter_36_7]